MKTKKIIVSMLLIAALLLSFASATVTAETHKTEHSYDIAIVFDNSGSMYDENNGSRWSQAIYSMEVFAAMIDYDKDKLGIYPMREIQIGKGGKTITERMDISSASDVANIEKIYSPKTSETILKPAYDAVDYLKKSDKDEKWLIVLTDGAFYYDKDAAKEERETPPSEKGPDGYVKEKTPEWLNKKLNDLAAGTDINIQYLGFGEASALSDNPTNNFYATNAGSADALTGELVSICNKIFKRNVVSNISSDGKFSVDVSMSSFFALAQGQGASIDSLTGPGGKKIEVTMDTHMGAPSQGTGNTHYHPVIADVSGQVMAFGAGSAGDYQLNFSGSNVQIFYEPNVKVQTKLLDKDGKEVDLEKEVLPGDYTLTYGLVDAETGQDVSGSPLLAPVDLGATIVNGGESRPAASGDTITLSPDDKTQINVEGTFLKDYQISNAEDGKFLEFKVAAPEINPKDLSVKVNVQNFNSGKKWYKLSDHDKWKPIRVEVTYKGEKLTDEQLENAVSFVFTPEDKKLSYRVEKLSGESAYNIYIGQDESGAYVAPPEGRYKIEATAKIADEYGRELTAKGHDRFNVSSMDGFWEWLLWLLIIAGIVLLVITILNLPAWPAKINCRVTKPKQSAGNYPVPTGANMTLVPFKYPLSCSAKKKSKLMHKFSKKACVYVSDVTVHRRVETFTVGAKTYARQNGFKDGKGKPFEGVITGGKTIRMTFNGAPPLECKIDIN